MKKYLILVAALVVQTCLGGVYAWSVFVSGLTEVHGFTNAQAQIVFGVAIMAFTVAMVFAGRLQDNYGPRFVAMTGGVLFGLGYLTASYSGGAFAMVLLGVGVISGAGIGFGYVCPLATCVKWFPKHKGLITGVAVAGFGGGAILLKRISVGFLDEGADVLAIFRWIGIWYGAIVTAAAFFLTNPPGTISKKDLPKISLFELFREKSFWSLVVGIFAGTFAGLMVIGNLQPIGKWAGIEFGMAAAAISIFAIGNAAGRVSWGFIADRIGRKSIPASLVFLAGAVGVVLIDLPAEWLFPVIAGLIGFGFGACFVVYVAQTTVEYGTELVGSVYPLIFLAYGISGLTGPTVGGWLYDKTGSYSSAIIVAAGLLAVGAVGSHLLKKSEIRAKIEVKAA